MYLLIKFCFVFTCQTVNRQLYNIQYGKSKNRLSLINHMDCLIRIFLGNNNDKQLYNYMFSNLLMVTFTIQYTVHLCDCSRIS